MEVSIKMATPADILRKPYARIVIPEEDGTYFAQIKEFPGCIATGDSEVDALTNLNEVALDWVEAALEQGQSIPEPVTEPDYSGKILVRLAKTLHAKAAQAAEIDGVSLNSLISTAVALYVGASEVKSAFVTDQVVQTVNVNMGQITQIAPINVLGVSQRQGGYLHSEPMVSGRTWNRS